MPVLAYDVNAAVRYLKLHAMSLNTYLRRIETKTYHPSCAAYVRAAVQAGGIALRRTNSAKGYGSSLMLAGFQPISAGGPFVAGDVVVIQAIFAQCTAHGNVARDHKDGHMAMYDGARWISDFFQARHSRPGYPGKDYDLAQPSFTVFRYPPGS